MGKIIMINPNTHSHRTAEESLALGYLTSILRESGKEVLTIDGWLRNMEPADIVSFIVDSKNSPTVICITCYRSNLEEVKILIQTIRNNIGNIPIIGGGYGPTFHDIDFLKAGMDIIVRGEADNIIVDLIDALNSKDNHLHNIPSISFFEKNVVVRTKEAPPINDLDDLPFPARDELKLSIGLKNPVHLCTSRGCNGSCTFCSIHSFFIKNGIELKWRYRSIKTIIDEIKYLNHEFGVNNFKFVDDSFLEPPRDEQWSHDFANAIHKNNLKIKFRTQIRADRLTLPIAQNLKSCGWFSTSIGIENFADTALKRMGKKAKSVDNLKALAILKECDILTQVGLILFDPFTTMEELKINYSILDQHRWIITKGIFTEMFAAQGTFFTSMLLKKGLLTANSKNQNLTYQIENPLVFRINQMLKQWHLSYAELYDWVIDSVTAPKVLTNNGYKSVAILCSQFLDINLSFFKKVLEYVYLNSSEFDNEYVNTEIAKQKKFFNFIETKIRKIYIAENLQYNGVLNPFL